MDRYHRELKIILPTAFGVIAIVVLSFFVPDIWTSNRNYKASQKPSAAEKLERFRSCLLDAGFVEGMPNGDFSLDPIHEVVDGVQTIKAFFYRFPDRILEDDEKVIQIEACKNSAAR
jgi:hypothetical protein